MMEMMAYEEMTVMKDEAYKAYKTTMERGFDDYLLNDFDNYRLKDFDDYVYDISSYERDSEYDEYYLAIV